MALAHLGGAVSVDSVIVAAGCPLTAAPSSIGILVALLPTILIILALTINFPWDRWLTRNLVTLEWLQHLLLHSAFYGSSFAVLLGLTHCVPTWIAPAFVSTFVPLMLVVSWWLGLRVHTLHQIAELDEGIRFGD